MMPTLVQVRNAADNALAPLWTAIQNRQDLFFAANGRYFQGLKTTTFGALVNHLNDANPVTGSVVPVLTSHPSDQAETWNSISAGFPATLPCAIEVGIYRTPAQTDGYYARAWAKWDGKWYVRTVQVGPETQRAHNWAQVTVPVPGGLN
jgi:hypothetical protein